MLREHSLFVRRVLVYLHALIALLAYSGSVALRRRIEIEGREFVFNEWTHLVLASFGVVLLLIGYSLAGIYRSNRLHGFLRDAQHLVAVNAVTFVLLLALAAALDLSFLNRLQIGLFHALNTIAVVAVQAVIRGAAAAARRRGFNFRNLLVAGTGPGAIEQMVREVKEHDWWGL